MKTIDGLQYVTLDTLRLYATEVLKVLDIQKEYFNTRDKHTLVQSKILEKNLREKSNDIIGNQLNLFGNGNNESKSIEK